MIEPRNKRGVHELCLTLPLTLTLSLLTHDGAMIEPRNKRGANLTPRTA